MKDAILSATKEVFELDIKPEAVRNSPVTPAGLEYNLAKGKKGRAVKGTGHNRMSVDVEVIVSPEGPRGTLFTQSGYGGYLETGTSKMRAQPYLFPAFIKFKSQFVKKARKYFGGLSRGR